MKLGKAWKQLLAGGLILMLLMLAAFVGVVYLGLQWIQKNSGGVPIIVNVPTTVPNNMAACLSIGGIWTNNMCFPPTTLSPTTSTTTTTTMQMLNPFPCVMDWSTFSCTGYCQPGKTCGVTGLFQCGCQTPTTTTLPMFIPVTTTLLTLAPPITITGIPTTTLQIPVYPCGLNNFACSGSCPLFNQYCGSTGFLQCGCVTQYVQTTTTTVPGIQYIPTTLPLITPITTPITLYTIPTTTLMFLNPVHVFIPTTTMAPPCDSTYLGLQCGGGQCPYLSSCQLLVNDLGQEYCGCRFNGALI